MSPITRMARRYRSRRDAGRSDPIDTARAAATSAPSTRLDPTGRLALRHLPRIRASMTDSSRTQGGLICVGVVVAGGAASCSACSQQSYWALALPVASSSSSCSGSTSGSAGRSRRSRSSPSTTRAAAPPTPTPSAARSRAALAPCASPSSPTAATCTAAARASTPPTSRASGRAPGHDVHVIAGPPLPALDARHPAPRDPERERLRRAAPATGRGARIRSRCSRAALALGAGRVALRRLPRDADLRRCACSLAGASSSDATASTSCSTTSASRWGLLGIRATGVPVVSVIHHPLHIDREADFAIDPRLLKKMKRTLYFPLLMQQQVAPRLDRIVTVSEASRARDRALLRHPREGDRASSTTAPTPSCSVRCRTSRRRPTCSSSAAPRTGRRASARCSRRSRSCPSTSRSRSSTAASPRTGSCRARSGRSGSATA